MEIDGGKCQVDGRADGPTTRRGRQSSHTSKKEAARPPNCHLVIQQAASLSAAQTAVAHSLSPVDSQAIWQCSGVMKEGRKGRPWPWKSCSTKGKGGEPTNQATPFPVLFCSSAAESWAFDNASARDGHQPRVKGLFISACCIRSHLARFSRDDCLQRHSSVSCLDRE